MIAYTITESFINLIINGQSVSVPRSSGNARKVLEGIASGISEEELLKLADAAEYISTSSSGQIKIVDGAAFYNGTQLPEVLGERIVALHGDGLPVQYLINFYERLIKNPSMRAINELYKFLEHKSLPITADGYLLAYKAINNNWTDKHTGTIRNRVGDKPTMPRNGVCDDADVGCSKGYHCGSLKYVTEFACGYGTPGGDRIVIVQVDPADVVSVPKDCDCQKVRCCRYEVVDIYRGAIKSSGVEDAHNAYGNDGEPEFCDHCGAELDNDFFCPNGCDYDGDASTPTFTQADMDQAVADAKAEAVNEYRKRAANLLL